MSHLEAVTDFGDDGSTASIYDDWAATYDDDLLAQYGYVAPHTTVDAVLSTFAERNLDVVDFGCGTGLVAEELRAAGWTGAIDGFDISAGMLGIAEGKDLYRTLAVADLTDDIDVADSSYDVMFCVGSMGSGHLGPTHLPELIRTVRIGGTIAIYMNAKPWIDEDYQTAFEAIDGWTIDRILETNYMDALVRPGRLVLARRV